jgi:hypothetical protein
MTKVQTIQYRPVDAIPDKIDEGILYVSEEYETAVHKCCCGCGHEVVTPLGATDWSVTIERSSVSVYPSIGNWSFACKSHYWIQRGRIHWAAQWSGAQIKYGRMRDHAAKQRQYGEVPPDHDTRPSFWTRLGRLLTGR